MKTPLPPVSSFENVAVGPEGAGRVVLVGVPARAACAAPLSALLALSFLLSEHDTSPSTATPSRTAATRLVVIATVDRLSEIGRLRTACVRQRPISIRDRGRSDAPRRRISYTTWAAA